MLLKIIDIIIVLTVFITLKYLVYYWTEKLTPYPSWLEYEPWCCRKCLGFWSGIATYGAIWWVFNLPMVAVIGWVLVVLDTVAIMINERKKFK